MTARARPRALFSLIGFLAMAFVVVGLTGILATYAAPVPLARALRQEAVLDQALASGDASGIDALAAQFAPGKSASPRGVSPQGLQTDLPDRVAHLRVLVRQTMSAEADATAQRLRLLIIVATIAGALFGAAIMGAGRR